MDLSRQIAQAQQLQAQHLSDAESAQKAQSAQAGQLLALHARETYQIGGPSPLPLCNACGLFLRGTTPPQSELHDSATQPAAQQSRGTYGEGIPFVCSCSRPVVMVTL